MGSRPKPPKQSAAQKEFERAQRQALNKEITNENRRRKSLIRGSLGTASLLSGLPINATASPALAANSPTGAGTPVGTGVLTGAPVAANRGLGI